MIRAEALHVQPTSHPYPKNYNGVIVWEGPSELDGEPIIVIATGFRNRSQNGKTGDLIQIWILLRDIPPEDALLTGDAVSICGDCIHLELGTCYVNVAQAPAQVYKGWENGIYPRLDRRWPAYLFRGRDVRGGAYGDPAAVPLNVWRWILKLAKRRYFYTHQWRTCDTAYAEFCMASCDRPEDRKEAKLLGYRTFRTLLPFEELDPDEFPCPASEEAGYKRTCATCGACGGRMSGSNHSPAIVIHGPQNKVVSYSRWRKELMVIVA